MSSRVKGNKTDPFADVMTEWSGLLALDSSSGVSDQQSVGSGPGRDHCVL